MKHLLKKELAEFLSSYTAYLITFVYLTLSSLFLFVFENGYNLFKRGYADLIPYFDLAPWLLILLVPALCMRGFAEERKTGTIELLLTRPIGLWKLVLSKFLASSFISVLAIFSTFIYIICIYQLGNPIGNIDLSSVLGAYMGLICLVLTYNAICNFASTLTSNQIVSFLVGVIICFAFYYGFEGFKDTNLSKLGIYEHYRSMGKAVISTKNLIYFMSIIFLFLFLTKSKLSKIIDRNESLSKYSSSVLIVIIIIFMNYLASLYNFRFDLTQDKRYTLSGYSKALAKGLNKDLNIDLYLSGSDLPEEFKYLQEETLELIKSYQNLTSKNIKVNLTNVTNSRERNKAKIESFLTQIGIKALTVTSNHDGKIVKQEVYPFAVISDNNRSYKTISLIENKLGADSRSLASESVQRLEYVFTKAFLSLSKEKTKKIGVLKGNGQMADIKMADFLKTLYDRYHIGVFSLDSISNHFEHSLQNISEYDLIISAKPSLKFEEQEKYFLDQYLMNGGSMLWLVDAVSADTDSLYVKPKITVYPFDLNLVDYFFSYGVRFKYNLILDAYSAAITVASGEGRKTQYNKLPWVYAPLIHVDQINHPITQHVPPIKLDFAGSIDTLKNRVKKTILMHTSKLTKVSGGLRYLSIDEISKPIDFKNFNAGAFITGVLLEGSFKSMYQNRVKPYHLKNAKRESVLTKMIVISDGDIIKNQTHRGRPLETGYDKWTHQYFGNKSFLINAVDYLLGEHEILSLRSKHIQTAQLDFVKTYTEGFKWKALNTILPIAFYGMLTAILIYLRKKQTNIV